MGICKEILENEYFTKVKEWLSSILEILFSLENFLVVSLFPIFPLFSILSSAYTSVKRT